MNAATVSILIEAQDKATAVMRSIEGSASGLGHTLSTALGTAGGQVAAQGIGMLTSALSGLGDGMIGANARLEQSTAVFNALTKDSGKTKEILDAIRTEAAVTPFDQASMIAAGQALITVAKGDKDALMDIMKTGEILAASNPAEGLEGAAFALKEAASGDFASVAERFNISREAINRFKAEGKTGIEVVRAAMDEMGLDASLVDNLANTFEGRKSSIGDFFAEFQRVLGEGVFEKLTAGSASFLDVLNENGPALLGVAKGIGEALGDMAGKVLSSVTGIMKAFQEGGVGRLGFNFLTMLGVDESAAEGAIEEISSIIGRVQGAIGQIIGGFQFGGAGGAAFSILTLLGMDESAAEGAVEDAAAIIRNVTGKIQAIIAGFQSGGIVGAAVEMSPLIGLLGLSPEQVAEAVATIDNVKTQISGAFDSLKAIFGGGGKDQAAGELQLATILNQAFGPDVASTIVGTVQAIDGAITTVTATIRGLVSVFQEGGLIAAIQSAFGPEVATVVSTFLATAQGALTALGTTLSTQLLPALGQFKDFIGPFIGPILQTFAVMVGVTVVAGILALSGALKAIQFVLENTGTAFSTLGQIGQILLAGLNKVATDIGTQWSTFGAVMEGVGQGIGQTFSNLGTAADTLKTNVGTFFSELGTGADTAKTNVITAFNELKGGVETAMSNMGQAIQGAINGIVSWAGSEAGKIATAIVDGITGALDRGMSLVRGKAEELAANIPAPIKEMLGIRSPSRIMFEIGVDVVRGLVNGMASGQTQVANIAANLGSATVQAFVSSVEEAGGWAEDGRWIRNLEAYLGHPAAIQGAIDAGITLAESFQNGWEESMRQFNPQTSFDFIDQRDFDHWQGFKQSLPALTSYSSADPKVQEDMRRALDANSPPAQVRIHPDDLAAIAGHFGRAIRVEAMSAG